MAQKILGDKIAFASQQFLNFDVLWFRRRAYKIYEEKKKGQKDKKTNLPWPKVDW